MRDLVQVGCPFGSNHSRRHNNGGNEERRTRPTPLDKKKLDTWFAEPAPRSWSSEKLLHIDKPLVRDRNEFVYFGLRQQISLHPNHNAVPFERRRGFAHFSHSSLGHLYDRGHIGRLLSGC